ncbi:MAG: M1 family metallopeptidase [Bacteroidota bacterium]
MKRFLWSICLLLIGGTSMSGQAADRWQQRVSYQMEIDFDVKKHQYKGKQQLVYINNSPDQLDRVFYHLYFNAFQPGSMMDVRSRTITDPDRRVAARISSLKDDEIGYQKIISLKHNGTPVKFEVVGTILEVELNEPIAPNSSAIFDMTFEAQVPVQIRRSGRDNSEGIAYSMSQWYPKLVEYDYQGWHANPYVGREFHGVWGDFDVKITIDKDYTIGGTGYLQNPQEIGHGYEAAGTRVKTKGDRLTWHFIAPNVHDFMWGADPDYTHDRLVRKDGTVLHFFYQKNEKTEDNWKLLPEIMDLAFDNINATYGQYPYKQYSFVQGGDGGMEYPMATLITGERSLSSLVGVSVHELMHSWYQMVLGTNESLYAWMDEGFTSFASAAVMNFLRANNKIPGTVRKNPHVGSLPGFINFSMSGDEEPLSTHADHFTKNRAYGVAAYTKGSIVMYQLRYIMGHEAFYQGLLDYYDTWKFKHPNANDFFRVMEKASGLELDWYKEYMVNTTDLIDYGIGKVEATEDGKTKVTLQKNGRVPMPIDLLVTYKDGSQSFHNIALRIMRGNKPSPKEGVKMQIEEDWPWTHPNYELMLPVPIEEIEKIELDPNRGMADAILENNVYSQDKE